MKFIFRTSQLILGIILSLVLGSTFAQNSANPRYEFHSDTVYDKNTNLTWMRCSVGQVSVGKDEVGCVGVVKTFTFDEAQQQGGSGWRVPTQEEISTLFVEKSGNDFQSPKIDEVAFPNMEQGKYAYWTSTTVDASIGMDASFAGGYVSSNFRSSVFAVRLVRSGK